MARRLRGLLVVVFCLAAAAAGADAPEAAYIAERQAAVAHLTRLTDDCRIAQAGTYRELYREDERLRESLQPKLVALIGERPPSGFRAGPRMNPSMLACGVETGGLDGLVFAIRDGERRGHALVTTEGLLRHWLSEQQRWRNRPDTLEHVLGSGAFYTLAFAANAGITPFASLPVARPAGAAVAALLVEESQTRALRPPQRIAVGVVRGGTVRLAIVDVAAPVAPIPECDAILASPQRNEDERERDYVRCWGTRLPQHPAYRDATRRAQQLVDGFALP